MGKSLLYITVIFFACGGAYAQNASKLMREGLTAYKQGDFTQSIAKYAKALEKGVDKNLANYNMGAAYYKAGKPDSALMYWQTVATTDGDKELQAKAWHNIGNSFIKQRNFEKAADAYKRALKLNPNDEDTRYNLAYSQRQLQAQQQKNQQDKEKEQKEEKEEPKQGDKPENKENLNKEEAEKILQALDNKEQDLHKRKKVQGQPGTPSKDW